MNDCVFKTDLLGLRKWHWDENLEGLFLFNEKPLTDVQARKIIEYGLSKGYRYDIDITDDEVQEILKNKVYERD